MEQPITLPTQADIINGRYCVIEVLGTGGMGCVFRARDNQKSMEVALKYLKVPQGKAGVVERFKHEFVKLAGHPHPNIGAGYDFGLDHKSGLYFFTSELINGQNFFQATRGMSPLEIEELAVQVLRALEYIHSHKLVHFDIKPANIIVTTDDNGKKMAKLIDFGVADFGFHGRMVGTPSYMAPEMTLKEIPDRRADLYSLGVMWYQVLAGLPDSPFRVGKDRAEILERQRTTSLAPLLGIHSEIPEYMSEIIKKLLAKNPNKRHSFAADVIAEINGHKKSAEHYEIETRETRRSYIPDNARFVGRRNALEKVREFLQSHQAPPSDTTTPDVLWITGEKGIGKTRLLGELNHLSQLNNFVTIGASSNEYDSWDAMRKALESAMENPNVPTLFWIDDLDVMATQPNAAPLLEDVTRLEEFIRQSRRLGIECRIGLAYSVKQLPKSIGESLHIALHPFMESELADYVVSVTGFEKPPSGFVKELKHHTDGNPYFVTEVMRALIDNGMLLDAAGRWKATTFEDLGVDFSNIRPPQSLADTIALEFNQLTALEQQLVSLLAVWNDSATIGQLQAVLGYPIDLATPVVLLKRGWVDVDPVGNTMVIPNPQRRMAVEALVGKVVKEAWHFKIGTVLKKGASLPESVLWHYAHCDQPTLALRSLQQLIDLAKTTKPLSAIVYSKHLLSKLPQDTVAYWLAEITLGQIYCHVRQYSEATKLFMEVASHLKREDDHYELLAQAYEDLVITANKQKKFDDAERYCMQGLRVIRTQLKDTVRQLRMENYLYQVFLAKGSIERAVDAFNRTRKVASQLSMSERAQITNNDLCNALFRKKQYARVVDEGKREMIFYDEVNNVRQYLRMNYLCAESLRFLNKYTEAETQYHHGIERARKRHDAEYLFFHYLGLGNLKGDARHHDEAIEYYTRALDLAVRLNQTGYSLQIMINLGNLNLNIGNEAEAERYCKLVVENIQSRPTSALEQEYHCRAHLNLANIYMNQRDFLRAHHHQTAAEEVIKKFPDICEAPEVWVRLTRAQLHLAENEVPKARPILDLLHDQIAKKLKDSPKNTELQYLLQEIEVTENTIEEN